jgi:hypothetical protein
MEAALRLGVFVLIFALTAVLELVLPRRPKTEPVGRRWRTNLGILLVDVVAQRLTVGAVAVAAALWAEASGFGLFQLVGWPFWLEAVLGFLALDFAVWLQHVVTHKVPLLWRLHQVHHADLDVDLTTGIRFHPVEIVLSALYRAALAALLGIDPWVVILFEAALNASAVLTHANVWNSGDTLRNWRSRRAPGLLLALDVGAQRPVDLGLPAAAARAFLEPVQDVRVEAQAHRLLHRAEEPAHRRQVLARHRPAPGMAPGLGWGRGDRCRIDPVLACRLQLPQLFLLLGGELPLLVMLDRFTLAHRLAFRARLPASRR